MASAAAEFGLVDDVEITTEANPDSVAAWDLEELRTAGFNRISFGMQSAVDHVLRTLDRTHDPMRVPAVVDWARQAGFDDVSLDLIYGTPGESLADWETSVDVALALRARPRLGLLAHRRGRHRDGPPGQARRAADARRGRPGRQVPPRRRAALRRRDELVRGVQLGARRPTTGAATTCSTGPAATGGASAPARTPTSAGCAGGTSSTRRRTPSGSPAASHPPWPARSSATTTSGSSGSCWRSGSSRGSRSTALEATGRSHVARLVADGLVELAAERLVLTQRGRLLADAIVRDLH